MLKAIRFHHYRAFEDAELPLSPITLLIGPNGSGKTSALSGIRVLAASANGHSLQQRDYVPIWLTPAVATTIVDAVWDDKRMTRVIWQPGKASEIISIPNPSEESQKLRMRTARVFDLSPVAISQNVKLLKTLELEENGRGLPAVLTTLQDQWPERFNALNDEVAEWLPGFDAIRFDTPGEGERAICLRTTEGKHLVPATKLSAGTLLSLTLLTICHLPNPPVIIGLEEPDYGVHPRLLRNLKNSLLRLTSPESFGDTREPVQVVITTHSPYLVDLFQEELASIVLIEKEGLSSTFRRLSEVEHVDDILRDAKLGDAWYSGVLGGVPEPR